MAAFPAARAAPAASSRARSASMACCAHALSRSVPVSVTATSSRSTWAPHRAWPATFVEGVIGLPGVVDGDAGEERQHPGGLHALLPALGVHGDQGELPPGGGVDPGEPPRGAEPGLVEVRDLRGDQVPRDRLQRRGEQPGGLARGGRERAGRRGAAEHLGKGLAGAVAGQELAVPQVDPGAHDPRPVLHRGGRALRGACLRLAPAAALQGEHLVLGGLGLHRRDVDDLAALDPRHLRALQGLPAAAALRRPVLHPPVRMVPELPSSPPAGPSAGPASARTSRAATSAPASPARPTTGACAEFREFDFTCAARSATCDCSAGQLLPQHPDLRVLLRDPLIPLRQQLPQPRVRSTKPRSIIGNTGHLGHAPHYTTTPPGPQIGEHRTRRSQAKTRW